MASGNMIHKAAKHIEIGQKYVTELIEKKMIELTYCPTKDMLADILTKPLKKVALWNSENNWVFCHAPKLGGIDGISAPERVIRRM
jgi:hypothetical protein